DINLSLFSMLSLTHRHRRRSPTAWCKVGQRILAFAVIATLATVGLEATGGRRHRKDDRALEALSTNGIRVIVRTQPGQRSAFKARWQQRGRSILNEAASIDALTTTISQADLNDLDNDDSVLSVSLDAPVAGIGNPKDENKNPNAPGQLKKLTATAMISSPG